MTAALLDTATLISTSPASRATSLARTHFTADRMGLNHA